MKNASPAARLLASIGIVGSLATLPMDEPRGIVAGVALLTLAVAMTRPSPKHVARVGGPAALIVFAVVVPFWLGDDIDNAAAITTRALITVAAAVSLASLQRPAELSAALHALRIPAPVTNVLGTLVRQLAEVRAEARRLALARALRGARGSVVGAEALASLFLRTTARAERVDLAMRLRGFGGDGSRRSAALGMRDVPALAVLALCGAAAHAAARL